MGVLIEQNWTYRSAAANAASSAWVRHTALSITVLALFLAVPAVHAVVAGMALGPLTQHMLSHIALMNVVAPLAAYLLTFLSLPFGMISTLSSLVAATIVQLGLLWAWHAPPLLSVSMGSRTMALLPGVSLTLAATWFWASIFCIRGQRIWRAIAALLITGKFVCLLGALLVFAPRALFECSGAACARPGLLEVADQQLAGLLMIIACPLTYVTAGVIAAARWLSELSRRTRDETVPFERRGGLAKATV